MILPRTPLLTLLSLLLILPLILSGCSRIQIAYTTAPFFIERYATDYLKLDSSQMARWEPRLKIALDAHRAVELPLLAGFFEALHQASQAGFDAANTRCLTDAFRDLYRRHARLAVDTAAPLLAGLTPAQVKALDRRFSVEYAQDQPRPDMQDQALEQAKRARRYVKSVQEWTGPLTAAQRALVADVTGRMPDTEAAVLEYRTRKRQELIALLRSGTNVAALQRFLTDWLVDYRDLPPTLVSAGEQLQERVGELLIRLGASLDQAQRRCLNDRLAALRDDLIHLQQAPRLVPMTCPA